MLRVQACANHCHKEPPSYAYYATQHGTECWCAGEGADPTVNGAATCDYPCSGDGSIVCGGYDAFSLYDLGKSDLLSPPTDENYVGCFADDQNDRVLGAKTSSRKMTPEVQLLLWKRPCKNDPVVRIPG